VCVLARLVWGWALQFAASALLLPRLLGGQRRAQAGGRGNGGGSLAVQAEHWDRTGNRNTGTARHREEKEKKGRRQRQRGNHKRTAPMWLLSPAAAAAGRCSSVACSLTPLCLSAASACACLHVLLAAVTVCAPFVFPTDRRPSLRSRRLCGFSTGGHFSFPRRRRSTSPSGTATRQASGTDSDRRPDESELRALCTSGPVHRNRSPPHRASL
jgi:hypothetical protein